MEIPEHFLCLGQPTRLQEGDHMIFNLRERMLCFSRNGTMLHLPFGEHEDRCISFAGTPDHGDILVIVLRLLRLLTPFKAMPVEEPEDQVYVFILCEQDEGTRPEPDLREHPAFR